MDLDRMRSHSVDDEECFGYRNCCNSSFNSDSEYSGSISVRDMIRHYDSQMKTNNTEVGTNTIRFRGLPRRAHHSHQSVLDDAGTEGGCGIGEGIGVGGGGGGGGGVGGGCIFNNRKNSNSQQWEVNDMKAIGRGCCKYCHPCRCCQNRSRRNSLLALKSTHSNTETVSNLNAKDVLAQIKPKNNNNGCGIGVGVGGGGARWLEFKDETFVVNNNNNNNLNNINDKTPIIGDKNHLPTNDSTDEATCHPIETSYQSKTTIAKTASGVRIIIDIFFDQEQQCVNTSDVLGSRVETDIPKSRILSEFQQQARAISATSLK